MTHKMCAWHNSLKYSLLRLLMLLMLKLLLLQCYSYQISALVSDKIMKLNWGKKNGGKSFSLDPFPFLGCPPLAFVSLSTLNHAEKGLVMVSYEGTRFNKAIFNSK